MFVIVSDNHNNDGPFVSGPFESAEEAKKVALEMISAKSDERLTLEEDEDYVGLQNKETFDNLVWCWIRQVKR